MLHWLAAVSAPQSFAAMIFCFTGIKYACLKALCALTQVDTPVRKLLLGIAVTYTALIVVLPFLNVFIQVKPCLIPAFSSHCIVECARWYTFCSG